jgi:hypothetical protein
LHDAMLTWFDIPLSVDVRPALQAVFGADALRDGAFRWHDVVLGDGPVARAGHEFLEHGFRTVLSSGMAARLSNSNIENPQHMLRVPEPIAAAVSQQWLLRGILPLHAALIVYAGRSLLVVGQSHAGKSTLTKCAHRAGAAVVSDDFIRVTAAASGARLIGHRVRGFLRERTESGEQHYWLNPEHAQAPIDGLVFLDGVRTRSPLTTIATASALSATMELFRQSSPLFLLPEFPAEAAELRRLVAGLVKLPMCKVQTGTDLIEDTDQVLQRIQSQLFGS